MTGRLVQKSDTTVVLEYQIPHKDVKTHSMGTLENSLYHGIDSRYEHRYAYGVLNSLKQTDPTKCSKRYDYGFLGFFIVQIFIYFQVIPLSDWM